MDHPQVYCCQFCGRVLAAVSVGADKWFVSPHRTRSNVWIIRCPMHISEWAMRHSKAGRTKEQRQKAAEGRTMSLPEPLAIDPFPTHWRGAQSNTGPSEGTS